MYGMFSNPDVERCWLFFFLAVTVLMLKKQNPTTVAAAQEFFNVALVGNEQLFGPIVCTLQHHKLEHVGMLTEEYGPFR
jgi:hypothetical protein